MVPTTFITARVPHARRVAAVFGLLFAFVGGGGCSTARPAITSLWKQVPPVRWPAKDSSGMSARAEPAMAANIAIKNDPTGETDASDEAASGDSRPKSKFARFGSRFNRPELRFGDTTAISGSDESQDANFKTLLESDQSDSPLERLNAALTDDALEAQSLPQRSLTMLDERVRADSLLSRAKQLFEIGQLDRARQTAQMAQELGETAQLDYSPDEDRPVDLVRRIESQLEATRRTDELGEEGRTGETRAAPGEPETVLVATGFANPPTPPGKDPSGLSRMRRDWSMLFRREKKPTAPESDPVVQAAQAVTLGSASDSRKGSPLAVRPSEPILRDAVVVANRSVVLGGPDSVTDAWESSALERVAADRDSKIRETPSLADPEMLADQDRRETSLAIIADPSTPFAESDDGTVVLPEFEPVEMLTPFHEVDSTMDEPQRPQAIDPRETIRESDWTSLYLALGLCSLLALGCYRRGAT